MVKVQFFLFGLLFVWFAGTGKLAKLWTALTDDPLSTNNDDTSGGFDASRTPPGPVVLMPGIAITGAGAALPGLGDTHDPGIPGTNPADYLG